MYYYVFCFPSFDVLSVCTPEDRPRRLCCGVLTGILERISTYHLLQVNFVRLHIFKP